MLPFTKPTVRARCFGAARNAPRTVSSGKVFKADEPWTTARPPAARTPTPEAQRRVAAIVGNYLAEVAGGYFAAKGFPVAPHCRSFTLWTWW